MSAVRVVLVDDHAMMRAGFRAILDAQTGIEVVGEAPTGRRALEVVRETRPDVVCMDVQMPDMDGLEATRLLTADPVVEARVLVVTTFDRDDYLFQALDAGASGFLLKNAGPEEIVRAVRAVAAGDAVRGASLVVWAVREGQDAAAEIDRYLKTRTEEVAA